MIRFRSAILLGVLLGVGACDFLRGYAQGQSTSLAPYEQQDLPSLSLGAARFLYDDFGALNTDSLETTALPWKLVAAALVLSHYPDEQATPQHLRAILASHGFIYPRNVVNWPMLEQPGDALPLGLVSGIVRREIPSFELEAVNLGCAACHAGVTYDASGAPSGDAWLGLPNTSLDLDAFFDDIAGALRSVQSRRAATFEAVRLLFPQVSDTELKSLQKRAWPRLSALDRPLRHGGAGRADLMAAWQRRLGIATTGPASSVSIPAVGDLSLRWSLLTDGMYTRRGDPRFQPRGREEAASATRGAQIVAFKTLPTLGQAPDSDVYQSTGDVLRFLAGQDAPRFPGTIDEAAALRGAVVYARCAECHGEYVERDGRLRLRSFPNRLSTLEEIGTDPMRAQAADENLRDGLERAALKMEVDSRATGGYVAPALTGIWATAPYLHNGSVPSLAALMTPGQRPARFRVAGHRIDFSILGIDYPEGYLPWAVPSEYDTSLPGQSNAGHEREFDGLSAADKADLLEFMKQL